MRLAPERPEGRGGPEDRTSR